jgi:uncharacterized protein involved in type VI secretion and phage assembly
MPNEFEKEQGILYVFREEDGNHILIIKDSQIQLFTIATKNPILLEGVIDVRTFFFKKNFG